MSKKIIAILTVITILFICVFAACEKEEKIYASNDEFNFVTDENGEKILAEDGQLLVYATDENGKFVKNENGEKVTLRQQFQPIEEEGVVEDYGFKLTLPEGWKTTDEFGVFVRDDEKLSCQITIVKYFYDDYYDVNLRTYNQLAAADMDVNWEEDIDFGEEYKDVCRFTVKGEDGISVLYFFENSENIYKILFSGMNSDTVIADTEAFCKAMEFKSFAYYDDITAVSEETTK